MATKSKKTRKTDKARRTRTPKEAPAAKPVNPDEILGKAMLVNVCISTWEGRKLDRKITQEVLEERKAASDAGRWWKDLFGGKVKERSAVTSAHSNLRGTHYTLTLPWSDKGWRLLPTANYMQYTEAMRQAIGRFNEAADEFANQYEKLVEEARTKLNGMFREEDYPSVSRVRAKYRASLQYMPLPLFGDDFRYTLGEEALEQANKYGSDVVKEGLEKALSGAWYKLGKAITKVRDKLDDGRWLRETMIENLRDVAELVGRLNVTGDAALEEARTQVLTQLATFDAETLKENDKVRSEAATVADAILKSMQGVYSPTTEDDENE